MEESSLGALVHRAHLESGELLRFAFGDFLLPEDEELFDHLIRCSGCHTRFLRSYPVEGREVLAQVLPRLVEAEVLEAWAGHEDDLVERLPEALRPPEWPALALEAVPRRVAELLALGAETRLERLAAEQALWSPAVAEALLEHIPTLWHSDPRRAGELALAAAEIPQRLLDSDRFDSDEQLNPLRLLSARAWVYRANALRIQGELGEAQEAMWGAIQWFEDTGREDPAVEGLLFNLESELCRDQRRFARALVLAEEGERVYREAGDLRMAAWMVVAQAFIHGEASEPEIAVELLEKFVASFEPTSIDDKIYSVALQTYAHRLVQVGRVEEAAALLPGVRESLKPFAEPLLTIRIDWLEGLIEHALGRLDRAEALFRRVQETFLAHEIPYDAALVSLDLAALYLEAGRVGEAQKLAASMVPIFLFRGIHREATAAGLLVTEALEKQVATVELIQKAARFLRQGRNDPSWRFDPARL